MNTRINYRITLYLNNDESQRREFAARTAQNLSENVLAFLRRESPDFCLGFEERPDDVPAGVFNYCESYRDYEYRDTLNDVDCDSGTLEQLWQDFVEGGWGGYLRRP